MNLIYASVSFTSEGNKRKTTGNTTNNSVKMTWKPGFGRGVFMLLMKSEPTLHDQDLQGDHRNNWLVDKFDEPR